MAGTEEDDRREAAISSSCCLQANFKAPGVSDLQLSKFQELHRRRLQIKSASKFRNKSKGGAEDLKLKDFTPENASETVEEPSVSIPKSYSIKDNPGEAVEHLSSMKRRKLHWGLDTKERWERKANM